MEDKKIRLVKNTEGPTLGYSIASGVQILEKEGCRFKNLSKDGTLHPYEDWRLSDEERAFDLAFRMSVEQIVGLMCSGLHQTVPSEGNPFEGGGEDAADLSDSQIKWISRDHVRHLLLVQASGTCDAARWNNNLQALAEAQPFGIPVTIGCDPRYGNDNSKKFNARADSLQTLAERCLESIMEGVDQFEGVDKTASLMAAYNLGVDQYGEDVMRTRLEKSAVRILRQMFRTGVFENPYMDIEGNTYNLAYGM